MKAKQLRRIIREAIQEIINEAEIPPQEKAAKDAEINAINKQIQALNAKKSDLASGRSSVVSENEIEEMARIAKGFRLSDENFDASQYANKRVSGTSLADIINYFRENPGADKKSLQSQFNFARPQIANAVTNALLDAGVLVKLGAGGEVEATPEPGEATPIQASEPEDMFMGSSENPLSMYFDNEPNDDGSEDFTDDTEPDAGEIEKSDKTPGGLSDEDFDAFMKYDELKRRLDVTKSNILKIRKSKGAAGDIADKPSTELQRLRDLKKSLEDRINTLVQSSEYLQKKYDLASPPPVELEPEEEDELKEGLDDYDLKKLQYYAGIRK